MKKAHMFVKRGWFLLLCTVFSLASCGGDNGQAPEVGSGDCGGCHGTPAAAWQNDSSHKFIYKECSFCHEEAASAPGEAHRSSPWCDNCHSEVRHPPESVTVVTGIQSLLFPTCMTCHYPMGSKNRYLIRESVLVDAGKQASVDFRTLEGRADYSFAELGKQDGGKNTREPGSGICEVCHTKTRYYNQAGSGGEHYRVRCSMCHDHAIGFRVKADCRACHPAEINHFFTGLHMTRKGMETWYSAENGGFELLTGVPYHDLGCKDCHRSDQPSWKEPNCRDCHEIQDPHVNDDNCLRCHGRQAAEINKLELTDVHRDAGMGCTDCHSRDDSHGDGSTYESMFEPGAMDVRCEDCHESPSSNDYHMLHSETVDCSSCHTQTVLACYNCHFDSEVLGKGKVAYGQFKDWKFLLNRNGKVYPGTVQTLKYGRVDQGTDGTFTAIAPYYSHSVARNAVVCEDCHESAAMEEYLSTGRIRAVQWNPETEKLEQATGVIPVPPDYETALKFHSVDWDGVTRDGNGKPVWTFFKAETDAFQMIEKYGAPLTGEQMEKLE